MPAGVDATQAKKLKICTFDAGTGLYFINWSAKLPES